MITQHVKALSISRPVFDMVKEGGLAGQVLANYHRACNLVTSKGEIIALVTPAIGNGPLNIVLEETGLLEHVQPGLPVVLSNGQVALGDSLVVLLDEVHLWKPEVDWECLASRRRRLAESLTRLWDWLSQSDVSHGARPNGTRSSQNQAFLAMAQQSIKGLWRALGDGDRSGIYKNAAQLAGLGPGLTPAGDDYLVGLMAGLRVWPVPVENGGLSPEEICQIILEATEDRTTLLSRVFLRSAGEGLFGENWHRLLAALVAGETTAMLRAAGRILSSGATSGADALAGFLSPYLWHRSGDFSRAPRS